jgi:DNA-directed RNA polymerase subunit RPC12/RpoP
VSESEITCECGKKFKLEVHPGEGIARCPECGMRIRIPEEGRVEDFLLVHGVERDMGPMEEPVPGSLAVTLDSITFIGPAKMHPLHLKDKGEVMPGGIRRNIIWVASVVTLMTAISFWVHILTRDRQDNGLPWVFLLVLGVITVVAFWQVVVAAIRMIRGDWPKKQTRDGPPFMLDMKEVDRFVDLRRGRRSLHEQITESANIEKKIRQLAKYRPGSVRMGRKVIGSVQFDGSKLTVLAVKRKLVFSVPPDLSERLAAILRGYEYMS